MAFGSLHDILNRLKSKNTALSNRLTEADAINKWSQAVGPAISKHTRAIKVENKILWVEVDHPIWKTELSFKKIEILKKLTLLTQNENGQKSLLVEDIRFIDTKYFYSDQKRKRTF